MSGDRSVAGIILRDGRIFAARRPPGGQLGGKWEFPGGKVEEGEDDLEALARELAEEFDARVRVGALVAETSFAHRGRPRALSAYLVELEPGAALLPKEHAELRFSSLPELEALDLVDSDRKLLPAIARFLGKDGKRG